MAMTNADVARLQPALSASAELVEQLDARVREVVRRDGVDPQRDAPVVRRIAESVVRDHDERSLTGVVTPVPDVAAVVGELVARVSGFGPLQPFLDDPAVEELWINSPDRVFVARRGRHELTNLVLTHAQVQELVERMLKSSGRRIDLSQPFVDAMLPEGHRLHVVLEGISRGFSAVNIRKFVLRANRLEALVELGSLSPRAAAFLEASVRAGLNILIAGGTQAGKTTMMNCLAAAIPGGERVVSAEEVFELPNMSRIQTCQQLSTPHSSGGGLRESSVRLRQAEPRSDRRGRGRHAPAGGLPQAVRGPRVGRRAGLDGERHKRVITQAAAGVHGDAQGCRAG
jgi:pilus assembly protein CpaF